jgi:RNA polymerase sigma-70 factor (ECF subfamily)
MDAPVITSSVVTPRVVPAQSTTVSVVEAAFDAHAAGLKAFARAAVRDEDAADDLVQETFLRFVRAIRANEVPENIGGWLHRVCANLVISRSRRRIVADRSRSRLATDDVGASPEDRAIRSDESARVREALSELPSDARVALLMAAAGYSPGEIGQAIGRSTGATSTYICRARARLRELLSSDVDDTR